MNLELIDAVRTLARMNGHLWLQATLETHGVKLIAQLPETAMRAIIRTEAALLRSEAA